MAASLYVEPSAYYRTWTLLTRIAYLLLTRPQKHKLHVARWYSLVLLVMILSVNGNDQNDAKKLLQKTLLPQFYIKTLWNFGFRLTSSYISPTHSSRRSSRIHTTVRLEDTLEHSLTDESRNCISNRAGLHLLPLAQLLFLDVVCFRIVLWIL